MICTGPARNSGGGVAGSERFHRLEGAEQARSVRDARGISASMVKRRVRGSPIEVPAGDAAKLLAKRVDRLGQDAKPGRGCMAAMADQAVRALRQGFMQLEAGHGSARTLAVSLSFPQGDHQHRPRIEVDQPAGHDAEQARMPGRAGQHQSGGIALGLRLMRGLRAGSAPFEVLPFDILTLEVLGQGPGELGARRGQQLDGTAGRVDPAGSVRRGAREKPMSTAPKLDLESILAVRSRACRADAGFGAQLRQAVADIDAVLIAERHDVGHGAHGRQHDGSSRNSRSSGDTFAEPHAFLHRAQASLKATPAPDRPLNG